MEVYPTIYVIFIVNGTLECISCQNLEINSRKHKSSTDFTDSECGISFLSEMRCMIRPQNYSVRKNFSN